MDSKSVKPFLEVAKMAETKETKKTTVIDAEIGYGIFKAQVNYTSDCVTTETRTYHENDSNDNQEPNFIDSDATIIIDHDNSYPENQKIGYQTMPEKITYETNSTDATKDYASIIEFLSSSKNKLLDNLELLNLALSTYEKQLNETMGAGILQDYQKNLQIQYHELKEKHKNMIENLQFMIETIDKAIDKTRDLQETAANK